VAALRELQGERAVYQRESRLSKDAAERFVSRLDAAKMERYLQSLAPGAASGPQHPTIESLSPEKRALLLERLRKRKAGP
jgi:hypothetical protein